MKKWMLLLGGLITPALMAQTPSSLCANAQRAIGGYDDHLPVRNLTYDSVDEFVASKPQVSSTGVETGSFIPPIQDLTQGIENHWCKMKKASIVARSFPKTLPPKTCADVQRSLLPAGSSLKVVEKRFNTGAGWAPSNARIGLDQEGLPTIEVTTLISADFVPVFGGMHYCKFITEKGLKEATKTLSEDYLPLLDLKTQVSALQNEKREILEVSFDKGIFGPRRALAFKPQNPKGHLILSPGGAIPVISMRGLAYEFMKQDLMVWVIKYPGNMGVVEEYTRAKDSVETLAQALKEDLSGIHMPKRFERQLEEGLPVYAFGHSLGGAILGDLLQGEGAFVDGVILYGVSQFANFAKDKPLNDIPTLLLQGENDGVIKNEAGLDELIELFKAKQGSHGYAKLPSLNHFCIITDPVGWGIIKNRDEKGRPHQACVKAVVEKSQAFLKF